MAKKSAHAKRTDQKYMSLPEYKKLDFLPSIRNDFKVLSDKVLKNFKSWAGAKALKRLKAQAKREVISPLEKLCRLDRLSRK